MSIAGLAEAAQTTGDNVAANLPIRHLGGPAKVTALIRATVTRHLAWIATKPF